MDKQARKLQQPREDGAPSEAGSEGGSNEESDHDEKVRREGFSRYIFTYFYKLYGVWFMALDIKGIKKISMGMIVYSVFLDVLCM